MAQIITPTIWTSQPQVNTGVGNTYPISSAWTASVNVDQATQKLITVTGTKVQPYIGGIAKGFYSTYGAGTTDRVSLSSWPRTAEQTIIIRFLRNGVGGGGYGRLFDNANNNSCNWNTSLWQIYRDYSVTDGQWSISSASSTSVWYTLAIVFNGSTSAPKCYVNGSEVSVTTVTTPSGTPTLSDVGMAVGNRPAGDRGFDGLIDAFVTISKAISASEIKSLSDNPWQIFRPITRRIYVEIPAATGETTINSIVGDASATGITSSISVSGGTTIDCSVGDSSATGLSAQLDRAILTVIANASAAGVSTAFDVTISATVGDASATGTTAARELRIEATVGDASATGITANLSGNTSVTCSVGDASATGQSALVGTNLVIDTTVGDALAAGYQAALSIVNTINGTTGDANAEGISAALAVAQVIDALVVQAIATGVTATVSTSQFTQAQLEEIYAYVEAQMFTQAQLDQIAAAVIAAAQATPIRSKLAEIESTTSGTKQIKGSGTTSDPWNPV